MAQEVVHSLKSFWVPKNGMILKIDLEKTYDKISWKFLRDNLLLAVFLRVLTSVIMGCVSSTSY